MLSFEQIEALEAFDAGDALALSVYLALDPGQQGPRSFGVAFEELVKAKHDALDVNARRELLKEASNVERWLSDQKPRGIALALFSCAPRGLWQSHWLAVPLDNHLAFEARADIAPLLADRRRLPAVRRCARRQTSGSPAECVCRRDRGG